MQVKSKVKVSQNSQNILTLFQRKSLFVRIWSLVPVLSTILKFVNFCSKEGFGINIAFEPDLYFGSEFLVNIMFWPDLRYFCFVVRYRTNQLIYTTYIGHTLTCHKYICKSICKQEHVDEFLFHWIFIEFKNAATTYLFDNSNT